MVSSDPHRPDAHDVMWAPWRMTYLSGDNKKRYPDSDCIFCTLAASDARKDAEDYVLFRGAHCFVVLNLYPYNNGHLMVIPYGHVDNLVDLEPAASHEMMDLTRRSQKVLARVLSPHGVNLGMNQGRAAGAGIADHLHLHVLPRWEADTNFMTPIGRTRILPQSLDDTYALLRPGFSS